MSEYLPQQGYCCNKFLTAIEKYIDDSKHLGSWCWDEMSGSQRLIFLDETLKKSIATGLRNRILVMDFSRPRKIEEFLSNQMSSSFTKLSATSETCFYFYGKQTFTPYEMLGAYYEVLGDFMDLTDLLYL